MKTYLGLTKTQWRRVFHVRWDDVVIYTLLVLFYMNLLTFF